MTAHTEMKAKTSRMFVFQHSPILKNQTHWQLVVVMIGFEWILNSLDYAKIFMIQVVLSIDRFVFFSLL